MSRPCPIWVTLFTQVSSSVKFNCSFAILIISSLIQLAAILSFTSAVKPKTIGGSIFFEV